MLKLCGAYILGFQWLSAGRFIQLYIIVFYMFDGDYGNAGTWPAWFSMMTAIAYSIFSNPDNFMDGKQWG